MPKFSITIPAYKKEFLAEAIESVLVQTYKDFELIIVDDCSPEDLSSVVSLYKDNRIHYFRNEKNCGAINVVDNWNICLEYCAGEFVICMGDDDRLLPCCLAEYSNLIEKYPELNVYHAWTRHIDERGRVIRVLEPRPEWESVYSLTYYRWRGRAQYIGDFCYRVSHLKEECGYFKLDLAWGSDDVTAARAAFKKGIANTGVVCFEYRVSTLTISRNKSLINIKLGALVNEKKWFEELLSNVNKSIISSRDYWYYSSLLNIIESAYRKRMLDELLYDIFPSFNKILYWLFYVKKYGVAKRYFVKSVLASAIYKVENLLKKYI